MDRSPKGITAVVGLLTALIVLFGTVTDQGWLPSFVKKPAQSALPGQQVGESIAGGGTAGGGTTKRTSPAPQRTSPPPPRTSPPPPRTSGDTCIQGYVWREAIPGDHVCVTPQLRDQAALENQLADSRRSPSGGDYGRDTCLQGFVWREVVPSDHVCVPPETRDQVWQDNRLAASRRVG
jgi:hypothetical protein